MGGILHTSLCCQLASMYAFSLGPFDVHVGIRNRGRGAACPGHYFQLVQESLSSLKRCLALGERPVSNKAPRWRIHRRRAAGQRPSSLCLQKSR